MRSGRARTVTSPPGDVSTPVIGTAPGRDDLLRSVRVAYRSKGKRQSIGKPGNDINPADGTSIRNVAEEVCRAEADLSAVSGRRSSGTPRSYRGRHKTKQQQYAELSRSHTQGRDGGTVARAGRFLRQRRPCAASAGRRSLRPTSCAASIETATCSGRTRRVIWAARCTARSSSCSVAMAPTRAWPPVDGGRRRSPSRSAPLRRSLPPSARRARRSSWSARVVVLLSDSRSRQRTSAHAVARKPVELRRHCDADAGLPADRRIPSDNALIERLSCAHMGMGSAPAKPRSARRRERKTQQQADTIVEAPG